MLRVINNKLRRSASLTSSGENCKLFSQMLANEIPSRQSGSFLCNHSEICEREYLGSIPSRRFFGVGLLRRKLAEMNSVTCYTLRRLLEKHEFKEQTLRTGIAFLLHYFGRLFFKTLIESHCFISVQVSQKKTPSLLELGGCPLS